MKLLWLVAWLAVAGAALANEADTPALLKLQRGGELSCTPTLPYFCENMHVRCSGRTPVETFEFKLRAPSGGGSLELATTSQEFQQRYERPNVEWDKDASSVLLSPKASKGYVKLLSDGKYVFRHYIQSLGVMSLGQCK